MIRYGDNQHPWPCPASVGHSTCLCQPSGLAADLEAFREAVVAALWQAVVAVFVTGPGRHRGPRPPAPWEAALVLAVLVAFVALVGALS